MWVACFQPIISHAFQSHCLWCAMSLTLAFNLYVIEDQSHGDCNSLVIKFLRGRFGEAK